MAEHRGHHQGELETGRPRVGGVAGTLGGIVSTASLALAGWSLSRTVAHDGELARLSAGRDTAVLGAKLDAVNERLARVETALEDLKHEKNR